jgi:tetrahydromethanopterin S-methyltransferase subunit B
VQDEIGRITDRITKLEGRVVDVERSIAITAVEFLSVKNDLREIKDSLTWVTRLIIGALILAILAFVFGGGLQLV